MDFICIQNNFNRYYELKIITTTINYEIKEEIYNVASYGAESTTNEYKL